MARVKAVLEAKERPPVALKLPQSEKLGNDPAAANRRFRFVFTDIGKGDDEVPPRQHTCLAPERCADADDSDPGDQRQPAHGGAGRA